MAAMQVARAVPFDACSSLTNSKAVQGKVVLVQRGGCKFWQKSLNAQLAGAKAVIIVNKPGSRSVGAMGCGVDPGCEKVGLLSMFVELATGGNALLDATARGEDDAVTDITC